MVRFKISDKAFLHSFFHFIELHLTFLKHLKLRKIIIKYLNRRLNLFLVFKADCIPFNFTYIGLNILQTAISFRCTLNLEFTILFRVYRDFDGS